MLKHEIYLRRCLDLAKQGETLAFPNPIVGCVIVYNDTIIAEGFHRQCGEAHAEASAINSLYSPTPLQPYTPVALQQVFTESTIYVSLEPCAHYGKTPPCADLIIKHRFKRLVFSSYDPNPLVSGQGIERIRAAGIEVIEPKDLDPELVRESDSLNRVFWKTIKAPNALWLTLKIAADAQGSMISTEEWITNSSSRRDVHRLRSVHQLVVTSIVTVRADNPLYTVRHSAEELMLADIRNPDVAILKADSDLRDEERKAQNIFQEEGRRVLEYRVDKTDPKALEKFVQEVSLRGYRKIMIEAGPTLSRAFIDSGLVDEIIYYQAISKPYGEWILTTASRSQDDGIFIIPSAYELQSQEIISGDNIEQDNIKSQFARLIPD